MSPSSKKCAPIMIFIGESVLILDIVYAKAYTVITMQTVDGPMVRGPLTKPKNYAQKYGERTVKLL